MALSMYSVKPTWQSCPGYEGQSRHQDPGSGASAHLPRILLPLATSSRRYSRPAVVIIIVVVLLARVHRRVLALALSAAAADLARLFRHSGLPELLPRVPRSLQEGQESLRGHEALVRALVEGALHAGGAEAGEGDGAREQERRLGRVERRQELRRVRFDHCGEPDRVRVCIRGPQDSANSLAPK